MARRRRSTHLGTAARWLVAGAVSFLTVGTVVLVALALGHVRSPSVRDGAAPVPTFGPETLTPTPTSAPTPTASPTTADYPRSEERFLAVGTGTMWRATAGECGVVEPLVERSDDDGATWVDVTPRYRGIGQVISLDAFAGTEAEMVVRVGADCQTQALRTFTQGEFWESYPDVLAASRYLDPSDGATIVLPGATATAPCAAPTGVRATGPTVALVCDGTAQSLGADGIWTAIGDSGTRTITITPDNDVVTASATASCAGVELTIASTGVTTCAPDVLSSPPLAIAATETEFLIWSSDTLTSIAR